MRILLLGGSGQLGCELQPRALALGYQVQAPSAAELDVSDISKMRSVVQGMQPDVIINSAAYTAVDAAERDEERCMQVNCRGAQVSAEAAKEVGARLIFVSTDYVFDGTGEEPLVEGRPTNPQGVYGRSKRLGECAIEDLYPDRSLIVRTSSLHGRRGENFVHTMLKLFATRPTVSVVADQWMSPTWAGWLAEALLDLARIKETGIVHASGRGGISWYEFADAILDEARVRFGIGGAVQLLRTDAKSFSRPAPRPRYSVFAVEKLERILGRGAIPWRDALRCHLGEIEGVDEVGNLR